MMRRMVCVASLIAMTSAIAIADAYEFIVEDDHVETVPSRAESPAISFDTGVLSTASLEMGLEARYLTRGMSDGVALKSTKYPGLILIFR